MLGAELAVRIGPGHTPQLCKMLRQAHQGATRFGEQESAFRLVILFLFQVLLQMNLFSRLSCDCSGADLQRHCFPCRFSFHFLLLIFGVVDGREIEWIVTLP